MQLTSLFSYPENNDDDCITTVLHKTTVVAPAPSTNTRAHTNPFLTAQALIYERLVSQDRVEIVPTDEDHGQSKASPQTASLILSSGLRQNERVPVPTIYSRILLSSGFREKDLLKNHDLAQQARTGPQNHGAAAKDFVEAYLDVGREILFGESIRRAEADSNYISSTSAKSTAVFLSHGKPSQAAEPPRLVRWADHDNDDGERYKTRKVKCPSARKRCQYSSLIRDGMKTSVFAPLRASADLLPAYARAGVPQTSNRAWRATNPTIFARSMSTRNEKEQARMVYLLYPHLRESEPDSDDFFRHHTIVDEDLVWHRTMPEVEDIITDRIELLETRAIGEPALVEGNILFFLMADMVHWKWCSMDHFMNPHDVDDAGLPNDQRLMQRFLPIPVTTDQQSTYHFR